MPLTRRFRFAVVFLIVTAYVLIALTFSYIGSQYREGRQLQCTIAEAQVSAVRAAMAQPDQPASLQAARQAVLDSWQKLSSRYDCHPLPPPGPNPLLPGAARSADYQRRAVASSTWRRG